MSTTLGQLKRPFTVCYMPPTQPANSLAPPTTKPEEPLETLAMAFAYDISVKDLWDQAWDAFSKACSARKTVGLYISHMKDPWGGKLSAPTPIESAYDRDTPRESRVIRVYLIAYDRDCSIPDGSILRPKDFVKRKLSDLTPSQRDLFMRRRQQEGRYGAAVDELSADMPVTSKEPTEAGAQERHVDEEDACLEKEHRRDHDGFAIPHKKLHPRTAATPQASQATVLVEDSQTHDTDPQRPTSTAALRNGYSLPSVRQDSTLVNHSSPAEDAAARANTTAPQPRPQRSSRNRSVTVAQTSRSANGEGRTQSELPTPDTSERRQSTEEAPTSAQRPPSSRAPLSDRTPRFVTGRLSTAAHPTNDVEMSDPIEDVDDNLLSVMEGIVVDESDLPDHIAPARGRTRSRSVESIRITNDAVGRSDSQHPPSSNAFAELTSSQAARASADRSGSSTKWSREEDSLLLKGIRMGMNGPQIKSHLRSQINSDRTEASIRNRKRTLLEKYPGGNVPASSDLFGLSSDGVDETYNPPQPSPAQPWTVELTTILRKAMGEGLDAEEIREKHFNSRSREAVAKKMNECLKAVETIEKQKPDFPRNDWNSRQNLRLRRAVKDGMDEHTMRQKWFSSLSITEVRNKMSAYKAQLEELQTAPREQTTQAANQQVPTSSADMPDQSPHVQSRSSPPQVLSEDRARSPLVLVPAGEQNDARAVQLTRHQGNGGQLQLNFTRAKGKSTDGPQRPTTSELDQQFGRTSSHGTFGRSPPSAQQVPDPTENAESVDMPAGNESDDDVMNEATDYERIQRELDSQFEVSDEPKHPSSADTDVEMAQTVMPAPSTTCTNAPDVPARVRVARDAQPVSVSSTRLDIPSNNLQPNANRELSRSSRVNARNPQLSAANRGSTSALRNVRRLMEIAPSQQLVQELEESVTSTSDVNREESLPSAQQAVQPKSTSVQDSDDESQAFQTQDPSTTRSQREIVPKQRANELAPSEPAQSQMAASAETGASRDFVRTTGSPNAAVTPRPSTYDISAGSNRPGSNTRAQRLNSGPQSASQSNSLGSVARLGPGRLPNINGPATRFAQRAVDTRTQASGDSTTQSQSQSQPPKQVQNRSQPEPVVTPPHDLREPHGPPDSKGMVFVGRPEFPTPIHAGALKAWSDRQLWEETAKIEESPFVQAAFDLRKVNIQLHIAVCGRDEEERARLYPKEQRMERELKKAKAKAKAKAEAEGLPPNTQLQRPNRLTVDGEVADPAEENVTREEDSSEHDEDSSEDDEDSSEEDEDDDDDMDDEDDVSGAAIAEGPEYPDGVDRERDIVEIDDENEEAHSDHAQGKQLLLDGHVSEGEDDDDDALPSAPPPEAAAAVTSLTEETKDDDEDPLPSAPPPETAEAATTLTDKQLQDLVQSGDVDMYDEASQFITTTTELDAARHNSPAVRLTPMPHAEDPASRKRKRQTEETDPVRKKSLRLKRKARKSRHPSDRHEASPEARSGRRVTPIGETQSTDSSTETAQPGQRGLLSTVGGVLGSWVPRYPPAPRPRQEPQTRAAALPFASDDEHESEHAPESSVD